MDFPKKLKYKFKNKRKAIATMAKVWLMSPNNTNIQVVHYDFNINKYFPNNFECKQFCINDIWEYYVVFFDAEDGGAFNAAAKWIASGCDVSPTGNFIVMRKKWNKEKEEEETLDMNISPKDFKVKFL